MALLSDIVFIFFSSIVVITPNGQLLDSATTVFRERHSSKAARSVNPRWMNLICDMIGLHRLAAIGSHQTGRPEICINGIY
jgi:hypothetical protein